MKSNKMLYILLQDCRIKFQKFKNNLISNSIHFNLKIIHVLINIWQNLRIYRNLDGDKRKINDDTQVKGPNVPISAKNEYFIYYRQIQISVKLLAQSVLGQARFHNALHIAIIIHRYCKRSFTRICGHMIDVQPH